MLAGIATTETYEEFISQGLCEKHLSELDEDCSSQRNELQRKALLYIRLRLLEPLLLNKPCICRKLEAALFKQGFIAEWYNGENPVYSFEETVMILDAIAVFIICYFAKMCCVGALFSTGSNVTSKSLEISVIQDLLEKDLEDTNLEHPTPLVEENFKQYDRGLVKMCYVATLIFGSTVNFVGRQNQLINWAGKCFLL